MRKLFYNYKAGYKSGADVPGRYEGSDLPSETQQGEAYSIDELMQKYRLNDNPVEPIYFDVDDINNINYLHSRNFDLTDLDDLRRRNNEMRDLIEKAQEMKDADENETRTAEGDDPKDQGLATENEENEEGE